MSYVEAYLEFQKNIEIMKHKYEKALNELKCECMEKDK
jgi:hypothetical protein